MADPNFPSVEWWQALGAGIVASVAAFFGGHKRGSRSSDEGCDRIVAAIEKSSDRATAAMNRLESTIQKLADTESRAHQRTRDLVADAHRDTRDLISRSR